MKFLRIFHESFKFSDFRLLKYSSIKTFSGTFPKTLINRDSGYNYQVLREFFINLSNFQIFKFSPIKTFIFQNFLSHFSKDPKRKWNDYNYNVIFTNFPRVLRIYEIITLPILQIHKFLSIRTHFSRVLREFKNFPILQIYEFRSSSKIFSHTSPKNRTKEINHKCNREFSRVFINSKIFQIPQIYKFPSAKIFSQKRERKGLI